MDMDNNRDAKNHGLKRLPPLALVQLALLVGALFLGLLSMHILMAPTMSPNEVMISSGQQQATHSPNHDSSVAPSDHDGNHGCADCPMDHQMSAIGCILALAALLLCLRPPGVLAQARKIEMWPAVLARCHSRGPSLRPDLTALGICRT
ncbi:hypothetical protein AQ436_03655 [Arthrobacter sp. EpRS66]|nr:hypothetical protein AQ436_03655 [Arthrobacter sp. EpRS66]